MADAAPAGVQPASASRDRGLLLPQAGEAPRALPLQRDAAPAARLPAVRARPRGRARAGASPGTGAPALAQAPTQAPQVPLVAGEVRVREASLRRLRGGRAEAGQQPQGVRERRLLRRVLRRVLGRRGQDLSRLRRGG